MSEHRTTKDLSIHDSIVGNDFDFDDEDDANWDDGEDSDEWVHDCGDPNCCMNFAPHLRSECHTPEMIEAQEQDDVHRV
jgi:hypothetical protein